MLAGRPSDPFMAEGIRATVEFPSPGPCAIAEVSAATDSVVDQVWASVSTPGGVPSGSEFHVDGETAPEVPAADHVLSAGRRHLFRLPHGSANACPCERIGALGCAVQRYVARSGTLRLVFNAGDYEELQAVVGDLRERFPDVDVRRLVRSPPSDAPRHGVLVDRGRLTDRQLEVLRTAYRMGYFERPRRANGSEIAEALDIAPSTFAEHLAAAQSKLLADLLEDGGT